ncbi:hypothetical protein RI570_05925 [Brucella pseudogrignonensis]|uniref:hypothetical protein n=1 Tax=Brucella pseudogrignonensis TaxID=419475 RepID=UPI0028B8739E|nr:hypothetical protein [Brucella pseudogrignonensis]MDT6939679.1 hypothetical protein [Brucella pseudogrignonensis]
MTNRILDNWYIPSIDREKSLLNMSYKSLIEGINSRKIPSNIRHILPLDLQTSDHFPSVLYSRKNENFEQDNKINVKILDKDQYFLQSEFSYSFTDEIEGKIRLNIVEDDLVFMRINLHNNSLNIEGVSSGLFNRIDHFKNETNFDRINLIEKVPSSSNFIQSFLNEEKTHEHALSLGKRISYRYKMPVTYNMAETKVVPRSEIINNSIKFQSTRNNQFPAGSLTHDGNEFRYMTKGSRSFLIGSEFMYDM